MTWKREQELQYQRLLWEITDSNNNNNDNNNNNEDDDDDDDYDDDDDDNNNSPICLSPMKKKHLFKNSSKTLEVQGSRNRNWDNMETKNNDCPSAA